MAAGFAAALTTVVAWSLAVEARGRPPETVACSDPEGEPVFGPCASPDPVSYFPPVAGAPALVMTNFGFLEPGPGPGRWQYVCDDAFGRPSPERVSRSSAGDVLIPTTRGLLVTRDGCTYAEATGDIAGKILFDVAVDAKNPAVVFALGDTPRKLWRSSDGGRSFTTIQTFPDGTQFQRVLLPPSRNKEVYLVGRGRGSSTPIAVSTDDGATLTMRDPGLNAGPALRTVLEPLGIDPVATNVLYFAVVEAAGDQLWRSSDGGATATHVVTLQDGEALTGLAFGTPPTTVYLAGKTVFLEPGKPRGHLYISRDAGKTWLPPVAADDKGPQFNCLVAHGNQLFACGVSIGAPEQFLVGVSSDEGKTWAPVTGLLDLTGPKQCIADRCQAVAQWLCDFYSSCPEGSTPTPNPTVDAQPAPSQDAGAAPGGPKDAGPEAPARPAERKSGGCELAPRSKQPACGGIVLVLGGLLLVAMAGRRSGRGSG